MQSHIRIASLQQTTDAGEGLKDQAERTVLEHVIHGDPYRNLIAHELEGKNLPEAAKRSC
jgi:hypothetical protein